MASAATGLIGAVTFWGSLIAFGKLQELITGNAVLFPGRHVINSILAIAAIAVAVYIVMNPDNTMAYWPKSEVSRSSRKPILWRYRDMRKRE